MILINKTYILVVATLLLHRVATTAYADIRATNDTFVARWHAANVAEAREKDHLQALPRVRVDLSAKTVVFYAEATGNPPSEPIEFFLIGEKSGNDYEAIAVALADPEQINAGIRLLGLSPGLSTDPRATRFWPKGERLIMTFNGIRAEMLIRDTRTGQPLKTSGFIYTGSSMIPTEDGNTTALAAQIRPPYSIVSNYNEPDSLLDVPWQAPQTAVYSLQVLNKDFLFKPGERIKVVMTPEYPDGKRRVQDMQVEIGISDPAQSSHATMANARFKLQNQTRNTTVLQGATIDRLLGTFDDMITNGEDPFVEVTINPNTPLNLLHQTASILKAIDSENGIRIEPPRAGDLYYQAFVPNEEFRRRQDRHIQPWELHITGDLTNTLTRIDEQWTRGEIKPKLTTVDIPIASPTEFAQILKTQKTDVRGVYVFAPPSLSYKELMRMIGPVLPTHPHIHIYVEEEPDAKTPLSAPAPPHPDSLAADPPSSL